MKRFNLNLIAILIVCIFYNLNAQWMQMSSTPSGYIYNIINFDGILWLSHSGSGVYKSDNGGSTWQQMNTGLVTPQSRSVHEILVDGDTLYAATVDGIYRSTNLGNNWTKKSSGITIGPGALYEFCESIFEYNGNLFTGTWNGIYRSGDKAENWTVTNATGEHIRAKNFTFHNGMIFAARELSSPNGYISTDLGITWNDLTSINLPTITFLSEPGKLWAGTIGGVYVSTDNGSSWQIRNTGLSLDPYSSSIIRINGILVTSLKFGGSGMFKSSNDGLNWEDFGEGLPFLNEIDKLIVYDNKIIAATSDGLWQRDISQVPVELTSFTVSASEGDIHLTWSTATETNNSGFEIFRSVDEDDKWTKISFVVGCGTTTEPHTYSYVDENIYGDLRYKLKQIDYDGNFQFSNVVEINSLASLSFDLKQNYPNPFNPTTKISYSVPVSGKVTLQVFNQLGEKVATLVDEYKPIGSYEVEFDANELPSGIYFYTLTEGAFTQTHKMVLLK